MATAKVFVFLFAILVSSTIILAQESEAPSSSGEEPVTPLPPPTGLLDDLPFQLFDFDAILPKFSSSGSLELSSRGKRSLGEPSELEHHSRTKRSLRSCNFGSQGAYRCLSCNQVLYCTIFNIGYELNCTGVLPHCNTGRCSIIPSSACAATTVAPATTVSSSDSSTASDDSTTSSDVSSTASADSSTTSADSSTTSADLTTTIDDSSSNATESSTSSSDNQTAQT